MNSLESNKKTVDELLLEFKVKNQSCYSEKIKFKFNDTRDIYNITAPFNINNETIIAARVEERDSEISEIKFFKKVNGQWEVKADIPAMNLQDPFVSKINDEIVVGGVEVYDHPTIENSLGYRTVFYKGKSLYDLKRFAQGPEMMKDIRLLQLKDNRILIFTRPQGDIGGRGTIGYAVIDNLEELNAETILKAKLLKNQFIEMEWGGANELHLLKNGLIGVLGHIAKFDEEGNRHYYSMVFAFNVENGQYTPMKIIATRSNFGQADYKRKDLMDVIFSGGLIRKEDGSAELYCGVSDAEAHKIIIQDPLLEYENI